jgi:hypothetical protein
MTKSPPSEYLSIRTPTVLGVNTSHATDPYLAKNLICDDLCLNENMWNSEYWKRSAPLQVHRLWRRQLCMHGFGWNRTASFFRPCAIPFSQIDLNT